jgi:RNA polymerase sigma-70 factor (ECF subfamily)
LVERARHGDRDAYELLAKSVARSLYRVAYRILRDVDRADDAAQQALVAIWRELPKLRDPDRFDAWAHRLLARICYEVARKEKRWEPLPGSTSVVDLTAPDASEPIAIRDELERAFRGLSPEHRAVLVLHFYVGLSLPEIAETLGIPYGTAGSRLHYAARAMRTRLETDGYALEGGRTR